MLDDSILSNRTIKYLVLFSQMNYKQQTRPTDNGENSNQY